MDRREEELLGDVIVPCVGACLGVPLGVVMAVCDGEVCGVLIEVEKGSRLGNCGIPGVFCADDELIFEGPVVVVSELGGELFDFDPVSVCVDIAIICVFRPLFVCWGGGGGWYLYAISAGEEPVCDGVDGFMGAGEVLKEA